MSSQSTTTLTDATAAPPQSESRIRRPGVVLSIILICQLMLVLDMSIVNVALPEIQQALGFSASGLSWVINAYTLLFGGLLLLGARAGDVLGRRRTFLAGVAIFTLASLAGGFAGSAGLLLLSRGAQGVGAALAAPSALALLTSMFSEGRDRLRALGLYTAVSIGGASLGLLAGGALTAAASWRWVFFVNVPIGAVLVLLAYKALVETPRRTGPVDVLGALTATLGTGSLVYGLVRAASNGWSDAAALGALSAGVLLLGLFVVAERRAESPITPLHLFANPTRSGAYVTRLLLVGGTMGMFFFLTQYMQDVLRYGPMKTGLAFVPVTVTLFAASQASARVFVEAFGTRRVLLVGASLTAMGMAWLMTLSTTSGYLSVAGPLVLVGLGNGLAFVPLTSAALTGVAPQDAGAASGLVNVTQQLGGAVGLAVLVTVFGSANRHPGATSGSIDRVAAAHAFVVGADRAFMAAALLLLACLPVVGLLIRPSAARS